jgi:hypothetical protein
MPFKISTVKDTIGPDQPLAHALGLELGKWPYDPGLLGVKRPESPRRYCIAFDYFISDRIIYIWLTTIAYEVVCDWEDSTRALGCSAPQDL